MKRALCILAFIILLTTCVTPIGYALEEHAIKPVTISFDQLKKLVTAGSPDYQKDLQEIRKAEIYAFEMWEDFYELDQYWPNNALEVIAQMYKMEDADEFLVNLHDELEGKLKVHVYAVQRLYINHYTLLPAVEAAQRELEVYENELATLKQKLLRGLTTKNTVENAEQNVEDRKKAVTAAQKRESNSLDVLSKALGLDSPIVLDGLPDIDAKRITDRDMKADLAAYIKAASSAAKRIMKSAKDIYDKNKTSTNWYVYTVAKKDYETAGMEAEKSFPKVYQRLLDAYEEITGSTEVVDAQREYDKDKMMFERGMIARNKLQSSEMALQNAKDRFRQQEVLFWLTLLEYEFGLLEL